MIKMKRVFSCIGGFLFAFLVFMAGRNISVSSSLDKEQSKDSVKSVVASNTNYSLAKIRETDLYSLSAVLLDGDSKRVLWGKDCEKYMANASTTKIMTCILVLELGNPEDMAEVSVYAASQPKVKLYAKPKESFLVGDLLYSLMLESHNDTAVILAEYIGKQYLNPELRDKPSGEYSVEESKMAVSKFTELMNEKAKSLNCENTNFLTPNGLDASCTEMVEGEKKDTYHGTCARDLARIMAYCVKESPAKDKFMEICNTRQYSFYANQKQYRCMNHNALMDMIPGVLAGKTGFTNKAGYCYVAALESEGRCFIIALLGCGWPNNRGYKWKDAVKLFTYGCDNYELKEIRKETGCENLLKKIERIPIENGFSEVLGEKVYAELKIRESFVNDKVLVGKEEKIHVETDLPIELKAPIFENTKVGEIKYYVGEKCLFSEDIVVVKKVEKAEFWRYFKLCFERFLVD